MDGLDTQFIDEFLPHDLTSFEDEFVLDQLTADDLCFDTELIKDIWTQEELESWTGGSSISSSPTFSHQNGSVASDSDEEKSTRTATINPNDFLRDVVVDNATIKDEASNRDTPSPGSTSSSSGCFSDFSNSGNDLKGFPQPALNVINVPIVPQTAAPQQISNIQPTLFTQIPNNIQYVQIPKLIPSATRAPITVAPRLAPIAPKPIQIKPKPCEGIKATKTVVLSKEEFDQLMKKMKVTNIPPTIQTVIQPSSQTRIIPKVSTGTVGPATATTTTATFIPRVDMSKPKPLVPKRPIEPLIYTPNQLMDERVYKKQQRQIKNREAASTSRRKKKEYMDSLEETIQDLSREKEQLMRENNQLRVQLLNNICSKCNQPVVMGNGKMYRRPLNNYVTKKNSIVLLAMILTVSLNFGPLNNMLTGDLIRSPAPDSQFLSQTGPKLRRHILWAEDDPLKNDSLITGRNRSSSSSTENENNLSDETHNSTSTMCSNPPSHQQYINQTENVRIASELRRWIGEPEYLNSTGGKTPELPSILSSLEDVKKNFEYDGNFLVNMTPKKYLKNRKLQMKKNKNKKWERYPVEAIDDPAEAVAQVEVFRQPRKVEMKYAELFEELRRRDDTFYVVSFNADHLMLPALAYNKTKRPKMSLMFPAAVGFNESLSDDHIMMMQIDCEVVDTALIQVREKLIPDHLKRYDNGTTSTSEEPLAATGRPVNLSTEFGPHPNGNSSKEGAAAAAVRKPYFVDNSRFNNSTTTTGGKNKDGFQ